MMLQELRTTNKIPSAPRPMIATTPMITTSPIRTTPMFADQFPPLPSNFGAASDPRMAEIYETLKEHEGVAKE